MRLSTNTIFAAGQARLTELQSGIVKTQQQISTGRKILTPGDDPVAAAQAIELSQGQSVNTQFVINRQNTNNSLLVEEGILEGTTGLLQDVKTAIVNAGSGVLTDTDRSYIATDLKGRLAELFGQANTTDGTGNYLFAGFQVTTPPFSQTATGATYNGDQGQRYVQVANSRQISLADTGDAIFQNVPSSGIYTTKAVTTNTGGATISAVALNDATLLKNHDYKIQFDITAGVTTYSVLDTTSNTTLSTNNAYNTGTPIIFDGRKLSITDTSGAPANNDTFEITQDKTQSVFKTLTDLINILDTPTVAPGAKATLDHALAVANDNIDNALSNVLTIRASVGSRLKELSSLNISGEDRALQYSQSLSALLDVDYNEAISSFTQQNTTLEAAQKTFVKVSGLSLFNLL
jgi:flagellar hook-associated protein 3 FlgL